MINNLPVKFCTQRNLLKLLGKKARGTFNYLSCPNASKVGVPSGFAFVNMISPAFILPLFLELHLVSWNSYLPNCNSDKVCEIIYGNVQGFEEITSYIRDTHRKENTLIQNDIQCDEDKA
jgi:hypothetical protein